MQKFFRRCLIILVISILASANISPALAASISVKVNTNTKVYCSPSTSSASLPMKKGLKLKLTAVSGNWAQVKYNGVTGYCNLAHLNTTSRYPGYTSKKTYIYKSASTGSSKIAVSANTKVYVIGKSGSFFRVQNANGSVTGYIKDNCISKSKVSTASSAKSASYYKSKVVKLNWYGSGEKVLEKGEYGYIYDIKSGQTIRIKRMGGSNHADVEPATASDTAKLKSACGGEFSWDSRPVILIAGGKYVACAINTMPHGDQTIDNNNYDGQFCLHMIGSKTHGSDSVNEVHQEAILDAYKWAH
ncbi:MAG: hypothetical protein E7337_16905 [Clostridiales bacterium]|nr:hypothetical protein [Clostridiales bacterium]